jgi:F-type H+-transporting ATPase subunit b
MNRSLRRLGITFITAAMLSLSPLHAQNANPQKSEPRAEQSSTQSKKTESPRNPNAVVGSELAEASKAAEGEPEDQTTGLRHSVAVKWIAKKTGISVETAYWIAMFINFAIVFAAIAWLMKSQLPSYFRTRNEAIQRGILEARAASEDARRRLSEIEARLSKLDAEVAEIRTSSESESVTEEARIRAAAETDVKRVLESAEQEIEAATRQARRELKALAAGLAVDLAARKLQVDEATDEALVRDFVSHLGRDGE